jgi:carbon monoxide dehydrogenase subunit G
MQIQKTITVAKPLEAVFAYLCDFTTTTEWDPGTVRTIRDSGDGGIGTEYRNTTRFLGRETQLTYVVQDLIPHGRIHLRGENATLVANDTMTFMPVRGGTKVTYTADFTFKGAIRLLAPLLRPAIRRLGNKAESGMRKALNALTDPGRSSWEIFSGADLVAPNTWRRGCP